MIRRVPASEFNKHFDKCTNATLLNNAKHKLARKRKIMERIAAKRGRTRKHKVDKSSKVSPEDRAENFAEEGMTVEAGVLWCSFCSTQVRRQCCAIKQHCKTQMHARNKKKADRDSARASAIKTVLDFATLSGTLQEETLLHRAQVCRAFVQENISFELLRNPQGLTRSLLQYHRGTLPRNETMAFIPMLLEDEIKRVTQELLDAKDISFSFDGTTEVAELLGVIVRFVCSRGHGCADHTVPSALRALALCHARRMPRQRRGRAQFGDV